MHLLTASLEGHVIQSESLTHIALKCVLKKRERCFHSALACI
jgi:hypothetical protein